jgi:hypothetical protein
VLRYVRNFAGPNRLGGLVTVRNDRGRASNLVAGVDGSWRFTPTAFVRGTMTQSTSSGAGGEGVAGYVWAANDANWAASATSPSGDRRL